VCTRERRRAPRVPRAARSGRRPHRPASPPRRGPTRPLPKAMTKAYHAMGNVPGARRPLRAALPAAPGPVRTKCRLWAAGPAAVSNWAGPPLPSWHPPLPLLPNRNRNRNRRHRGKRGEPGGGIHRQRRLPGRWAGRRSAAGGRHRVAQRRGAGVSCGARAPLLGRFRRFLRAGGGGGRAGSAARRAEGGTGSCPPPHRHAASLTGTPRPLGPQPPQQGIMSFAVVLGILSADIASALREVGGRARRRRGAGNAQRGVAACSATLSRWSLRPESAPCRAEQGFG
jgi:hypothetical protein